VNTIIKSILAATCLLLIASCQKKDTTPVDRSKVTVSFNDPASGMIYHKGDTVQINASISYISEIVGVGVEIIDTTTGESLFEADHDLHTDHYTLSESWIDTVSDSRSLQVRVSVFVAHDTEPAKQWAYFVTQP
jgi:hypothetical protein